MAEQKPEIMKRTMGLFEAVAMITGLVVGASIFVLVPSMTGMAGPSVYLAYAAAAIPAIFVVLYEIQLTGTLPVTGANFVTVTRVLSPFWGAVISFSAVLAIIASNILVAVGFSQYLIAFIQTFNPAFSLHPWVLPILIVAFFALINYLGVQIANWIQAILFVAFILGMVIFSIVGTANMSTANLTPLFPNGVMMFVVVMVLASFSWAGLVALADIGGEIKNPRRNLPLALIIAFIIIVVLYTWQPFALVASMGWQEVAKAGSPAIMLQAGKMMPGVGIWIIFIAAMGAILTTINALTMSCARDLVAWARDGLMPKAAAHLHSKFKTPDVAVLIVLILEVVGIMFSATIDKYALAAVLALMLIQVVSAYCVLRIPNKLPELYKKAIFKFNGFWRWFTFLGTAITSGFILLMGIFLDTMDKDGNPTQVPYTVLVFIGVLVVGVIYYFIRKAYLKGKGIDLSTNLRKVADATLAEAEEKLTM
ncbi:MAG: APC family permease [Dehalococcoidia bacterium]|nr:APC family permease [Dehalococcoidia bacterium]